MSGPEHTNGATHGASNPPWWASVADEVDRDEDPLTAHRAARAGRNGREEDPEEPLGDAGGDHARHDRHAGHGGAPWGDLAEVVLRLARDAARSIGERERHRATANAARPDEDATAAGPSASHGDTCQYHCPVCAGLRALDEVRPELVTHLSEAARHVTLAARAFVDAQADRYAGAEDFQRIDLDDEV